jgi:hypothetical protein
MEPGYWLLCLLPLAQKPGQYLLRPFPSYLSETQLWWSSAVFRWSHPRTQGPRTAHSCPRIVHAMTHAAHVSYTTRLNLAHLSFDISQLPGRLHTM